MPPFTFSKVELLTVRGNSQSPLRVSGTQPTYRSHKGGPRMKKSSEAFAQLAFARDKADAAARQLFELSDNPEAMRKAADAFAHIAEIFTRWQKRAKEVYRPGNRPALIRAVMRNDPEKVAALIEAGVPLDERDEGETALHWAVSRRYVEIVAMLVKAGADPNVADNDGCTPMDDVAEIGDCRRQR